MTDAPPASLRPRPVPRPRVRPALLALAFWCLPAWAAPADAAIWYVRKSGNDANAGTSAGQAFRTLQRAADADTPNDIVVVGPGTYTESVSGIEDGTAGDYARWYADPSGAYTGDSAGPVVWRPANGGAHAVRLGAGHRVVFFDFRFRANPDAPGAAGAVLPNAHEISFFNCAFEDLSDGILATDSGGFTAHNCTFTDCGDGADVISHTAVFTGCAFTDCDSSVRTATSATLTVEDGTFTNAAGAGNHLNLPAGTDLTLRRCTVTGGLNGVYQPAGPSARIEDCTFSGASSIALWLVVDDATVDRCDISSLDTAIYLPGTVGAGPLFRDTTIRDSDTGIYTKLRDLTLRNVVMSGHFGEAIHVAPANPSFRLGAEDTVTVTNNARGLRWEANGSGTQSLTVAGQTWADNGDHVLTNRVSSVDVRDCAFTGGANGVFDDNGGSLTVRDCTFRDVADPGGQGGVRADCPTLAVSGCLFERCYNGLRVRDAVDPDVRDCTFRDSAFAGMEIGYGSWNWTAADNLTFVGNEYGVYATRLDLDVDGGAAGIEIVGPATGGTGFYAFVGAGRTLSCRNFRATSCGIGFRLQSPHGATLEDCSATDCSAYGVHITHDSSNPAPVAAVVRNFTAAGCVNGLGYVRGSGVPAGQGQIELRGITATKPVAVDGDGYPAATVGTGVYLYGCPLDPAHHSDLTVDGYHNGFYVRDAGANLTAAMNVDPSRCRNGLLVVAGALTATGYVSAATRYALYLVPNYNSITLNDCDLTASDRAVYVRNGGDLTADGCTFEGRDFDGVLYTSNAAPSVTLTNCTATAAGDGFTMRFGGAGEVAFTDCTVAAAGDDGFDVGFSDAAPGTATFDRCHVHAADDDGFRSGWAAVTCRDCTVAAAGDDGFQFADGPADVTGCAVAAADEDGFDLRECPASAIAGCTARGCGSAGVYFTEGTGAEVVNLLVTDSPRAVLAESTGTTTLTHATLAAAQDAMKVTAGNVTVRNSVLVGGDDGCNRTGGTVAFDHVLLHAPTPYDGATPGPDDILKAPLFRDPAAGDYRLAEGSPAINAGADLSGIVDFDLLGVARPTHRRHDLGAYEYAEAEGSLRILDWRERAE